MTENHDRYIGGSNEAEKTAMTKINIIMLIVFIPLSIVIGLISTYFGWIANSPFYSYEHQSVCNCDSRGLFYRKEINYTD